MSVGGMNMTTCSRVKSEVIGIKVVVNLVVAVNMSSISAGSMILLVHLGVSVGIVS